MINKNDTTDSSTEYSRRDFLNVTASAVAFEFVPRHVLGDPEHARPSEKLNIA